MECPRCTARLMPGYRQGVHIDACPACGGVWLDRGELDAIFQRFAQHAFKRPSRLEQIERAFLSWIAPTRRPRHAA